MLWAQVLKDVIIYSWDVILPKPRRMSPEPAIHRINFLFIIHRNCLNWVENCPNFTLIFTPVHYSPITCIQCSPILSSEALFHEIKNQITNDIFSSSEIIFPCFFGEYNTKVHERRYDSPQQGGTPST